MVLFYFCWSFFFLNGGVRVVYVFCLFRLFGLFVLRLIWGSGVLGKGRVGSV